MSINIGMDKEDVVHIDDGILLSHKKNESVPLAETQVDLETIIQSEVSQKEKDKYSILMHIYGIQKNGTEEFIYRAAMGHIENKCMDTKWGRRGMNWETRIYIYTLLCIKQITNENLL